MRQTTKLSVLVIVVACAQTNVSSAYLIDNVTVLPAVPNPSSPVSLEVLMTTPNSPAFLASPSTVTPIAPNSFAVDVFPDSGPLEALGSLTETASLGTLRPGDYDFRVTLVPPQDIPFGREMRVVNGSFTVVPEPSTVVLVAVAVGLVAGVSRLGGAR